ncbi:restriction endonuclease subunit S [Methylobacterium sp. SD274]|uniref:restriction endonuclease subunit S n=1 Tax=Methylobacterium sp. SD274 TaxID=2782009 RepID=UPI001A95CC29|nr:restriction endonuclease subunit S [Methylobacterium sp. SD274]MBO1022840.1 restriction endonuclease subunit S [Methylobacterium sp. SD274]
MSFPAYSSYKDSGTLTLGLLPTRWAVGALKWHLARNDGGVWGNDPSGNGDTLVLRSTEQTQGGLWKLDDPAFRSLTDQEKQSSTLRVGDLLITKSSGSSLHIGKTTLADNIIDSMKCCYSNFMQRLQVDSYFIPKYMWYILNSGVARTQFGVLSNSTTGLANLSAGLIGSISVPIPSISEQDAIVTFLDHEMAKIDALIEEQRRLIVLLKEKRQAVISGAVTKGLNSDVPIKDSGVEWLGKVPAHWDVIRIKHIARMESGHTPDRKVAAYWEDCDIPWVSLHDTTYLKNHDYISKTAQQVNALGIENSSARLLPPGVVVFSRDATIGRCAITTCEMAVSQHFIAWVCSERVNAEFLLLCLRSMAGELERLTAGATLKTIGMPDVRTLTVAIPDIAEQEAIVACVRRAAEQIDQLIREAEAASILLQERRAALISAAVTGKIDVRPSAAVLNFPVDRVRARRLVATEVIERLAHQPTFGRTKLQKILYLAETHANINELAGCYIRMPYGPLDQTMINEVENGSLEAGFIVDDPGDRKMVRYHPGPVKGRSRDELAQWLGDERIAKLDKLITDFADLDTRAAEAAATLYAVWNDAIIDGETPADMEIVLAVLSEWHPEKAKNFGINELQTRLDWMRRHGFVPSGAGSKTSTGRLFA